MPAGRPTKLTPEVQKKIVDALARGNYVETAVQLTGEICEDTYYEWLKRAGTDRDPDGKFQEFSEAVKRASAIPEDEAIQDIRTATAQSGWQARAWWLERRFPQKWGRVEYRGDAERVDVRGDDVRKYIEEQLDKIKSEGHDDMSE